MGGVSAVTLNMIGWKDPKSGRWLDGSSMRINQSALLEWFCFLTIPVVFSNARSLRHERLVCGLLPPGGRSLRTPGVTAVTLCKRIAVFYDQLNMCHGFVFLNLVSPRRPFTLLYGQHMCSVVFSIMKCPDSEVTVTDFQEQNRTANRRESAKSC